MYKFTSKHRQDLCNTLNIKIENNLAVPKLYVKDLGVTPDNALSMESHVRTVSKTCQYHLRNISRIRYVLSEDACRTIIQALVTSRLDYALLYGHLQPVQNMAVVIGPEGDAPLAAVLGTKIQPTTSWVGPSDVMGRTQ